MTRFRQHPFRRGFTLVELMIVMIVIGILAAISVPVYWHARNTAALGGCEMNLRNIASAIEIYSNDNGNLYPTSLNPLLPTYLKHVPECPAALADTYSPGYTKSTLPSAFTVYCSGTWHTSVDVGPNAPVYTSLKGMGQN